MRNAPEKIEVVVTEGEIRTRSPGRTPDALKQLWIVERAHTVSVVIPCYKQAHFLGEAIESVLAQSHPAEIVVVDDGSPDNTKQVASRYPQVRYIWQENKGLAEARNAGFRITTGDYVIFLDADDRLTPNAIGAHLGCFAEHPEAGFVVGDIDNITEHGSYSHSPRWPIIQGNVYEDLLKVNHVANTIAVMFRRRTIERVGGFKSSCSPSEDVELLLHAARLSPSAHHRTTVADYRRHGDTLSRKGTVMLPAVLRVMQLQDDVVKGNWRLEKARRQGVVYWRDYFGRAAFRELIVYLRRGQLLRVARALGVLVYYVRWQALFMPFKYWRRVIKRYAASQGSGIPTQDQGQADAVRQAQTK